VGPLSVVAAFGLEPVEDAPRRAAHAAIAMRKVVNYRPEYRHEWSGKTYYHQLRLDPLLPEQASEFLETLLGGDVGLAPLKPLLLARTEGNPFFLEEGVRSLVDDGVLLGDRGAYQLVKAPEAYDVPGTVQAILAARIDRLPADDRDLLQIASVVGTDVPVAVLAAVAGRATDALADGLARLQFAEFLYETTLVPDAAYTFKHALTHDVAYGSLLHERRRALHVRIGEAIETLYPDRLAEHVERLAHHAVRGERWRRPSTISVKRASRPSDDRPTGKPPPTLSRCSRPSSAFPRPASATSG
jgi:predicted ATPase